MTDDPNELRNKTFARRFAKILRDLGILLGPATVIGLVCQMMDLPGRVTAEVTVGSLLITAVIFFAPLLQKWLHVAIPATAVVILAAGLLHVLLFRQPAAEDPWLTWQHQVEKKVADCENEPAIHDICIGQAIAQQYPKPKTNLSTDVLHNDLRAGAILMTINPVKIMLEKRIGIKDHFLGDGFAQPDDKEKPDALVPEYFAPNLNETHADVWTWALAPIPQQLNKKVAEIIESEKDTLRDSQGRDIQGRNSESFNTFAQTVKTRLGFEAPAVIRFGRFPPEHYSHKMGPEAAKRVFTLHLGSVYSLTLGEAARLSGYSLESARSDHDKFWVWVYLPSDGRDLVRPTWREIIPNLKRWLAE